MAATMNAATFMGKNFLKKMFDITVKLVGEQEEINNVDNVHWEKHSWKQLSLIGDVFSDSVLCLGRVHPHPMSNEAWKERIGWIVTDKSYRDYQWRADRVRVEYFPRMHCVAALR